MVQVELPRRCSWWSASRASCWCCPVSRLMRWALAGEGNRRSLVSGPGRQQGLVKRTLRHPIRGDRLHPKPPRGRRKHGSWRGNASRSAHAAAQERQRGVHRRLARGRGGRARTCGCASSAWSCCVLFGVLVLRLWTLQVVEGKSYAAAVTRNQVRVVSVPAPRGEIVDRNGTVLVSNDSQEEILLLAGRRGRRRTRRIIGHGGGARGPDAGAGAGLRQQRTSTAPMSPRP